MTQVVWEGKWLLIISTIIFTGVFFVYLQRPLLAVPIKLNFDIEALCRGRLQRGTISTLRKSIETLTDFVISSVVQVTSSSGIPSDMIKEIDHTTELTTEEAKITTTTLTTTTLTTPSTTMTSTTTPPFDIHPGTIITTIKSQSSLSSSNVWCPQCKPALHALVDKYFEPHRNGITKDIIDDAFYVKIYVTPQDSMALIQVINSTIYADLRRMDHYPWNRSRLRFIVSRLQEFLDQRRKYCEKNHFPADECQPNFEFVVDVVDCQNNWPHPGTVRYGNRTEGESRIRQDSFPIFAMTKCKDRNSIPAPQWHIDRDGAFEDYDKNTKKFLEDAYCEKPDEREPVAVHYASFVPMTTYHEDPKARCTSLNKANWFKYGRGKVRWLGLQYPSLIHARLGVFNDHVNCFTQEDLAKAQTFDKMDGPEQAKRFKYVIYTEGACGWADRLKRLQLYNSTILLQETSCREYYHDLLVPYEHYIPVKESMDNLLEQVVWARKHPKEAAEMAKKAMKVHLEHLNVESIRCYSYLLYHRYSQLLKYKPTLRDGVTKVTPSDI